MSTEVEEIQKLAAFLQAHGVVDYTDQAERYVRRYSSAEGGFERMWRHCRQKFSAETASAQSDVVPASAASVSEKTEMPKGAVETAVLMKIYNRIAPDRASGAAAVVERRIDDPAAMREMWAALCAKYNLTMEYVQSELRETRIAMEAAGGGAAGTAGLEVTPPNEPSEAPLDASVVEARLIAYLLTVAPDRAGEASMLLEKLQELPGGLVPSNVGRLMTSLERRFGIPEPTWDALETGTALLDDMRELRGILQTAFRPLMNSSPSVGVRPSESVRQIEVMYSNSALSLDAAGRRAPQPDHSAFYRSAKYAQVEVTPSQGLTPEAAAFWQDRLTSLISEFSPRVAARAAAAILTRCERPLPRSFAGPLPRPAAELVELAVANLRIHNRDSQGPAGAPAPDFVARFMPNAEDLPLEAAAAFPIEYALRDPLHSPLAVARLVGRQTLAGAVNADPSEADPVLRPAPAAASEHSKALVAAPASETFNMLAHRTVDVSLGLTSLAEIVPTRELLHGSFEIMGLPVGALQDFGGDERLLAFVEALSEDLRDSFGRFGLSTAVTIHDMVTGASGSVRALWTMECAGGAAAGGAAWLRSKVPPERTLPTPKARLSLVRDLGLAPAPLFIGSMQFEYFGARRTAAAADNDQKPIAAETLIYAPMSAHVSPHRRTANGPITMPRPPLAF